MLQRLPPLIARAERVMLGLEDRRRPVVLRERWWPWPAMLATGVLLGFFLAALLR
jgi:hypothetical protein